MEFQTETEQFLYDERKAMMKERDEAREELRKLKQKSSDTFKCFMYNLLDNDTLMYAHPTHNATMIIKKDGHTISLDPNEIKDMVRAAGANFKR